MGRYSGFLGGIQDRELREVRFSWVEVGGLEFVDVAYSWVLVVHREDIF